MKRMKRVEERKERRGRCRNAERKLGTNRARVLATTSALLERDSLLLLPNQRSGQLMLLCEGT